MKTLLVPVDFTPASENGVKFAVEWSSKYLYERIILVKSFYTSMYESVIMAGEFANVDQHYLNIIREKEEGRLNDLRDAVDEETHGRILVQSFVSEMPLVRAISELIKSEHPEMILLGNDQANNYNAAFVAGNVIGIAKSSPVRVLVVPATCSYKTIQEVLVPCDFNTVESLNKINCLNASPRWRDVTLIVLNVNTKGARVTPDERQKAAEDSLHEYLKNFKHRIHYAEDSNVIRGILNFPKINEVQMMFALPGRYSFLYSLTHKSISEALYGNTSLPVMILK